MICNKCGADNPDGNVSCRYCGQFLTADSNPYMSQYSNNSGDNSFNSDYTGTPNYNAPNYNTPNYGYNVTGGDKHLGFARAIVGIVAVLFIIMVIVLIRFNGALAKTKKNHESPQAVAKLFVKAFEENNSSYYIDCFYKDTYSKESLRNEFYDMSSQISGYTNSFKVADKTDPYSNTALIRSFENLQNVSVKDKAKININITSVSPSGEVGGFYTTLCLVKVKGSWYILDIE